MTEVTAVGQSPRALVIDDDQATCQFLSSVLTAEGYSCQTAQTYKDAEHLLRNGQIDFALIDVYLVGQDSGLDVLKRIKEVQPQCNCIVMTGHASVETAALAVAEGAVEYLSKPLLIDDIMVVLRKAKGNHRAIPKSLSVEESFPESSIVGRSPKMLEVYRAIARVAPSNANVVITGASGTGKELVARAVHAHSKRSQKTFTPINCGSFTETILESELFGHEKGAFTGADSSRPGLIEATNKGTLFLDEISETSLSFQVKLLRVLQEQQVRRIGSNTLIPVDVRILAATNRDLGELIRSGKFREDLYYRLSVVNISIPSLEERREDIPLLVRHFLDRFNEQNERQVTMEEGAVEALCNMTWPGNVRELENTIQRLAIFSSTAVITAADVKRERGQAVTPSSPKQSLTSASGSPTLREMERQHILKVLAETGGNKSEAARRLGIERKTLYQKALRLGIDLHRGEV